MSASDFLRSLRLLDGDGDDMDEMPGMPGADGKLPDGVWHSVKVSFVVCARARVRFLCE